MSRPDDWRDLFHGGRRPLVGMVHLAPLPGAPYYEPESMARAVDRAVHDVEALVGAGFDAVLFVNEGDMPYPREVGRETVAGLAAIVAAARPRGVPFGVEALFDPDASLCVAVATGASFVRGSVLGAWEDTSGFRTGGSASVLRRRAALGATDVGVFAVAQAELAHPLTDLSLSRRLRLAAQERAMDAVLLGALPGRAAEVGDLEELREAAGGLPVLANSGVKSSTVRDTLSRFDGCLVGSDVKEGGRLAHPVDPARARRLVDMARATKVGGADESVSPST